jgi:hypothetical protein
MKSFLLLMRYCGSCHDTIRKADQPAEAGWPEYPAANAVEFLRRETMYNMYPDYSEAPKERGEGGLGHYDYPVYENTNQTTVEASREPVAPTPQAERAVGYISVSEMVME